MRVWIVEVGEYDGRYVAAVHATQESALAAYPAGSGWKVIGDGMGHEPGAIYNGMSGLTATEIYPMDVKP